MEGAEQWLREKGLAASAKRADRENTQGAVALVVDGDAAAIVELKCETDFVAKSEHFNAVAQDLAEPVARRADRTPRAERPATRRAARSRSRRTSSSAESSSSSRARRQRARQLPARAERAGVNAVLVELVGQPKSSPTTSPSTSRSPGRSTSRGRGARGRRREGARDARGDHPQRGQARAGDPEDRRGSAQRLLQGHLPARAAVTPRTTSSRSAKCSATADRALRPGRDRGLRGAR